MLAHVRAGIVMLAILTVLTGLAYPLAVTAFADVLFRREAHGSLIERDGRTVGSTLIAQRFAGPAWFHPRPSVAGSDGFDAAASAASNLAPTARALKEATADRMARRAAENPQAGRPIPADLITTSASGLDPHISPEAAEYQILRVAAARGMAEDELRRLVAMHTEDRTLGFLGEPRVNVLALNLDLASR
ncbi:MAG: potassium-transporting ATPase subunit KdpC [Alphaproteobacteria bacterium]